MGPATDPSRLIALGADGVTAMICDSTNALREGRSPSEMDVARSLARLIAGAKRRVAVTIFASNVARIKAVADAAKSAGRQIVVAGRALHRIIGVAMETGYLPANFKYHDQQHFSYLEPDEVVLLCTGSQGEQRAAMARIAEDQHPDVRLDKGDLVIFSSRTIPGNERTVGRIQNRLVDLGCDIVTDGDALVHVTGHPRREELKEMYGWVKPRIAIPMHGEARHLSEHAKLARAAGVEEVLDVRNGDMVRLAPGRPRSSTRRRSGGSSATDSCWCRARTGRCASAARWPLPASSSSRWRARAGARLRTPRSRSTACRQPTPRAQDGRHRARGGGGHHRQHSRERRRDGELVREAVRRAVRSAVEQRVGQASHRQGAADTSAALTEPRWSC